MPVFKCDRFRRQCRQASMLLTVTVTRKGLGFLYPATQTTRLRLFPCPVCLMLNTPVFLSRNNVACGFSASFSRRSGAALSPRGDFKVRLKFVEVLDVTVCSRCYPPLPRRA